MTVVNFDGNLLTTACGIERALLYIQENKTRNVRVVSIVSAGGMITNLLYSLAKPSKSGREKSDILETIRGYFSHIEKDLDIPLNVREFFAEICGIAEGIPEEYRTSYYVSRGHYLTARAFSLALPCGIIPSEKLITLDGSGGVDFAKTKENFTAEKDGKLSFERKIHAGIVVPGSYGYCLETGYIKLFPRKGGFTTAEIMRKIMTDPYNAEKGKPSIEEFGLERAPTLQVS